MLVDYQMHLTIDTKTGGATAYLIKAAGANENWSWVGDTEFGPFDTASDVGSWLRARLALDKAFKLG